MQIPTWSDTVCSRRVRCGTVACGYSNWALGFVSLTVVRYHAQALEDAPQTMSLLQPDGCQVNDAQALEDAPHTRRFSKAVIKPALEAVISALLVRRCRYVLVSRSPRCLTKAWTVLRPLHAGLSVWVICLHAGTR